MGPLRPMLKTTGIHIFNLHASYLKRWNYNFSHPQEYRSLSITSIICPVLRRLLYSAECLSTWKFQRSFKILEEFKCLSCLFRINAYSNPSVYSFNFCCQFNSECLLQVTENHFNWSFGTHHEHLVQTVICELENGIVFGVSPADGSRVSNIVGWYNSRNCFY